MKKPEGLHVSLVEEGMLDGSGVLRSADGCAAAYGLPDRSIQLFLLIAMAGEQGLAQGKLPRDLRDDLSAVLLPLELQNLVEWERDNRGQQTYLVMTWRGREALDAARMKPTDQGTWATRRRAAVCPAPTNGPLATESGDRAGPAPKDAVGPDGDVFGPGTGRTSRAQTLRRSISAGGPGDEMGAVLGAQVEDLPLDFGNSLFS